MKIKIIASGELNDAAQQLIATGRNLAFQLEGRTAKRVLQLDGVTCIIEVKGSTANIIIIPYAGIFAYKYPDAESYGILEYDSGWVAELDPVLNNYGNVDWKGSDGKVLAWKGVASRHFSVDTAVGIANYMVFDEEITQFINGVPFEVPVYTPFGPNIYATGSIISTIPNGGARVALEGIVLESDVVTPAGYTEPKVLGCAYDPDGRLTAVVGMNYRSVTNPAGTTGGFFLEVYKEISIGWTRIWYGNSSRPKENWFFNQSGSEAQAVVDKTIKKISISDLIVTFSRRDACTGSGTENKGDSVTPINTMGSNPPPSLYAYDPADYTAVDGSKFGSKSTNFIEVSQRQSCIVAVDYVDDAEVTATASFVLQDKSTYETEKYTVFGWDEECPAEPPGPLSEIFGPDVWPGVGGAAYYSVSGGCTPYEWVFPPGGSCGMGTVSVTDATGATKSKSVRLEGKWSGCSSDVYSISGDTKTCYVLYSSCCGIKTSGGCYPDGTEFPCTPPPASVAATFEPVSTSCGVITSTPTSCDYSCWNEAYCPAPYVVFYSRTLFYTVPGGTATWVCP